MLFSDAQSLNEGDEMFVTDGVGRATHQVVTKLSGPYYNGFSSHGVLVVRDESNQVRVYNLGDLVIKPAVPVEGQTWVRKTDGKSRYVAGVTDNFVIVKQSAGASNARAYVVEMSLFLTTYRKYS